MPHLIEVPCTPEKDGKPGRELEIRPTAAISDGENFTRWLFVC